MCNFCEENAGNNCIRRVMVIYLNYKPRCPKLGQSAGQDLGPVGFANRFLYPGQIKGISPLVLITNKPDRTAKLSEQHTKRKAQKATYVQD